MLLTSLLADIDETKTLTCFCSPSEDMLDVMCGMLEQQQQQQPAMHGAEAATACSRLHIIAMVRRGPLHSRIFALVYNSHAR